MCLGQLFGHPFVQESSSFDSSTVGLTLQEAQRGKEVHLTSAKLDGPNSSWLDTTNIYGVEREDSEVCLLFPVCFPRIFQLFIFFIFFFFFQANRQLFIPLSLLLLLAYFILRFSKVKSPWCLNFRFLLFSYVFSTAKQWLIRLGSWESARIEKKLNFSYFILFFLV